MNLVIFTFLKNFKWIEGGGRGQVEVGRRPKTSGSEVNEEKFSGQISLDDGLTNAIYFSELILL